MAALLALILAGWSNDQAARWIGIYLPAMFAAWRLLAFCWLEGRK